jgi:hypothetical protein
MPRKVAAGACFVVVFTHDHSGKTRKRTGSAITLEYVHDKLCVRLDGRTIARYIPGAWWIVDNFCADRVEILPLAQAGPPRDC